MAIPRMARRCSSRAPTSATETLRPWAMRSLRLLTTRRLSLRDMASGTAISTWSTPTVIRRGGVSPPAQCIRPIWGGETPPLQGPLERLPHVGLEGVADLDVVVVGELDAALQAGLDLADVVLEALER